MPDEGAASEIDPRVQRKAVRERYASIATDSTSDASCCGPSGCGNNTLVDHARTLGYSDSELNTVVDGANLGLGCGNPIAIANLNRGERVLDLGSGAGFDCFLAGQRVGDTGRVIGVDMTPEMIEKARDNAEQNEVSNVEFRLGEIEHLPVADSTIDVVISNCVINLSPDQSRVYREAYRVLRPGGRLSISDVVLIASIPADLRDDLTAVASCVAGAATVDEIHAMASDAGFTSTSITLESQSNQIVRAWDSTHDLSEFISSARILAEKPGPNQSE